jgi:lipoate-protein ligase A
MFIEPEGAITWSVYAPDSLVAGMSFPESYAALDSWVIRTLRDLGIDAWYAPLNDITSANGKIGGAAQARRLGAVLHHTTMAYEMNVPLMLQTLRIGQEKLSDKGTRSADKRVGPLRQQTEMSREAIITRLHDDLARSAPVLPATLRPEDVAEAERRVHERFGNRSWTHLLP